MKYSWRMVLIPVITLFLAACDKSTEPHVEKDSGKSESIARTQKTYSPYVDQDHPLNVYWGETHLHTSYSTDAGFLSTFIGPDEAYRFAKGEVVT